MAVQTIEIFMLKHALMLLFSGCVNIFKDTFIIKKWFHITLMFHGDYLPASIYILMLFKSYMGSFHNTYIVRLILLLHSMIILLEYERECMT